MDYPSSHLSHFIQLCLLRRSQCAGVALNAVGATDGQWSRGDQHHYL